MESDDIRLVRRAKQGDRDAYAILYDRYAGLVRALCFDTTANLDQAQDLAQEAFLRAYDKLPSLRDDGRFGSWLVGITRHVGDEWRKRRRRDRNIRTGIPSEALAVDSNAGFDSEQEVLRALARLPAKQRLALHLYYLQGKSAAEARGILALSQSGFYKLLETASQQIAKLLETGE